MARDKSVIWSMNLNKHGSNNHSRFTFTGKISINLRNKGNMQENILVIVEFQKSANYTRLLEITLILCEKLEYSDKTFVTEEQ